MPESAAAAVPPARPGAILAAAGAAGLGAGLAEAAVMLARRHGTGRLMLFGPDLVWMAPLADLALFLVAGLLFAPLARLAPALRRPQAVRTAFAALGALAVLLHVDALHPAASALLAAGLGAVAGRWRPHRPLRPGRAFAGLAAAVLGLLVLSRASDALAERRALASLPAAAGRANVLLLVLDTARAWNFGWYGHPRPTTPLLDRRVQQGTVFDRALAPSPWTLPSHATLFTGRQPFELSAGWDAPLDDTPPTLAEALRDAGYVTGGFVANYRYAGRATGLARGFSRYEDYPRSWDEALRMTAWARRLLRLPRLQEWLGRNRILEARPAAEVNRAFLAWLDRRGDRPFFAFLNYLDAHSPYLPPPPFDTLFAGEPYARRYVGGVERVFGGGFLPGELLEEYLDGYDGALRYLDTSIDALLGELDRRGLLANTVVALTSDHGEHFGEHNLIQHGNSLYLPLLHVPLVIWAPGGEARGLRVPAPVSLRDLPVTLLDLAGVANPGLPGRSLAGWWRGAPAATFAAPVSAVDWHANLSRFPPSPLLLGSLRSVVLDSVHYIRRADGREELYHPDRDFLEARNLVLDPAWQGELARARAAAAALVGTATGPVPGR